MPDSEVAEQPTPKVNIPALRVETPAPAQTVPHDSRNTNDDNNATYDNSTGPIGKQRRRSQRKKKGKTAPPSISTPTPAIANLATGTDVEPTGDDVHFCLHSTVINPDTGTIADYAALSTSSEGAAWRAVMSDEFGRLCQALTCQQEAEPCFSYLKTTSPKVAPLRLHAWCVLIDPKKAKNFTLITRQEAVTCQVC